MITFTHKRLLTPGLDTRPGQRYADAPKAECRGHPDDQADRLLQLRGRQRPVLDAARHLGRKHAAKLHELCERHTPASG